MRSPSARSLRTATLTLLTTLGLAGAGLAAAPAHASEPGYVALGDSYSSGVGAGSYISSSGDCERSTKSYPYLWQAAHSPSSFSFVACSGATTADVLSSQLSTLSSSTGLVSISIGGNDAGFSSTMETCVLDGTSSCLSAVSTAETYINGPLAAKLDATYAAISAHAPNAHVVVLDYPHLYQVPGTCLFGISDTSRNAINGAADELDSVIAKRAANAGFTFVDVRGAFTGHEICSSDSWLHSTTLPIDESYHPTAAGQSGGYLPGFTSAAG
ncbi:MULTISPECIES: SGNH/GDSL hydrolase family protein [Streptacidiphilus]|uniref:SGNH/GDSL hydrolase family protein n=2 Tax=Streptacidiphilus TaxID=228398 RepID=A0ABV6UQA5_9ACTN|nr:SGNH/GDSL hydrolase family protein [Streptacidiphilus jeojiense]